MENGQWVTQQRVRLRLLPISQCHASGTLEYPIRSTSIATKECDTCNFQCRDAKSPSHPQPRLTKSSVSIAGTLCGRSLIITSNEDFSLGRTENASAYPLASKPASLASNVPYVSSGVQRLNVVSENSGATTFARCSQARSLC